MNENQAKQVIRFLELCYRLELDPESIGIYLPMLEKLDYQETMTAVQSLVEHEEYLPQNFIAAIRKRIREGRRERSLKQPPPSERYQLPPAEKSDRKRMWREQAEKAFKKLEEKGYEPPDPDLQMYRSDGTEIDYSANMLTDEDLISFDERYPPVPAEDEAKAAGQPSGLGKLFEEEDVSELWQLVDRYAQKPENQVTVGGWVNGVWVRDKNAAGHLDHPNKRKRGREKRNP